MLFSFLNIIFIDRLGDGKGKCRLLRQSSHPKMLKDKLRLRQLHKQLSAGAPACSDEAAFIDGLNLQASSTKSGKNAKQVPSLEYGFLVQVGFENNALTVIFVQCDESYTVCLFIANG